MATSENLSTESLNFNRIAVRDILVDELSAVTPAMIEAGSAAAEAAQVGRSPDGKRYAKPCSESELMTAIWRAMLAAALNAPRG